MPPTTTAEVDQRPTHRRWATPLARLLWTASLLTSIGLGVDVLSGGGIRWQFVTLWITSIVAADLATRAARRQVRPFPASEPACERAVDGAPTSALNR